MRKKNILGIGLTDAKKEEILEFIIKGLGKRSKKLSIFTPNPEILVYAHKHEDFKKVINTADLALLDGVGLLWGAKMLGFQLQSRIGGVDFMEALCKEAAKRGFTVGLMGGGPKIAERTRDCLLQKYPSLKITFAYSNFPVSKTQSDVLRIKYNVSSIKEKSIHNTKYKIPNTDILFVALGFPKQEQWIAVNLPKIPVRVAMAVGGSFDYISGAVPRAPLVVRNLGFEWLFRLVVQPWRIRRQRALIEFIFLVLKERFLGK